MLSFMEGRSSLIILPYNSSNNMGECIGIRVHAGKIIVGNRSLNIEIIYMDREDYVENIDHYPHKCLFNNNASEIVSISSFVSQRLGVKLGSNISICVDGECRSYKVGYIHGGRGLYSSSIIVLTSREVFWRKGSGKLYWVCRINSGSEINSFLNQLTNYISSYTYGFTYLVALTYFPIMYLGYRRAINMVHGDLDVLHSLGVSWGKTRLALGIVLSVAGLLMIVYGIGLGVLFMHLSFYILRFFGIIITIRPLPSMSSMFTITVVYALVSVASIMLALNKIGGKD
ncbi:hypothetical protein Shell_0863 [Staphylothermus hellenicus DSM 12710]|uniref:ABC3 transporter permease protein domain-containing protein n=2 Tax=Staphylothermus hellenicus TaxID=84599 RepID=D7D877_STAHD|nr:hypothetical protein Shell_0863 [Staphylothermus hellenicus DSM 12710]